MEVRGSLLNRWYMYQEPLLLSMFSVSDKLCTPNMMLIYLLIVGLSLLSIHNLYFSDTCETKMFGFKRIKMPLGFKLENQYATRIPSISSKKPIWPRWQLLEVGRWVCKDLVHHFLLCVGDWWCAGKLAFWGGKCLDLLYLPIFMV